jgi:hypothetical protein
MGVLRGESGDLSPNLSYITRPIWLHVVTNRPVGPFGLYIHYAPLFVGHSPTSSFDEFGNAMSVFLWSILYYLLLSIWFDFKFNWTIRIDMAFSVLYERPYSSLKSILFYYIILFSWLIWDLGMSEEISPLAPGWYRESQELSFDSWLVQRLTHLYYILFLSSHG